jgi:hypothetical protein
LSRCWRGRQERSRHGPASITVERRPIKALDPSPPGLHKAFTGDPGPAAAEIEECWLPILAAIKQLVG